MDGYQQHELQEQQRRRQAASIQMTNGYNSNNLLFNQSNIPIQHLQYPIQSNNGILYSNESTTYIPTNSTNIGINSTNIGINSTNIGINSINNNTNYYIPNTITDTNELNKKLNNWKKSNNISKINEIIQNDNLILDKTVLSKLLSRDESDISDEQIRSIMGNKDMLNIYKKLHEEEIKRQKRLDNNRKTAQMRRKKKKGLVETYEAQVSELENVLSKIHTHQFGHGDIQTLVEALSGEQRQSVNMTKDTKHQQTSILLKQHSQNASAIRQSNEDSWMVTLAASNDPEYNDLKEFLALSDAQCMHLYQLQSHIHNESTRLAIVEKCFAALHVHEWLHFPNTENLVDLFRAPLNDVQLQKFVQWTRVNQKVIQQLQFAGNSTDGKDKDIVFEFPSEL